MLFRNGNRDGLSRRVNGDDYEEGEVRTNVSNGLWTSSVTANTYNRLIDFGHRVWTVTITDAPDDVAFFGDGKTGS